MQYGDASLFGYGSALNAAGGDPELYAQFQADRNKQLIAQMLMARGQQQPQGQMVGRFYVPPSPLQHVAGLASLGLGMYGLGEADKSRAEGMSRLKKTRQEELAKALSQMSQDLSPTKQVQVEAEGPGAPVATPLGQETADLINKDLVPVGSPLGQEFAKSASPLFQEGPRPTAMQEVPKGKEEIMAARMRYLTHERPELREAMKFQLQQEQQAEQKALDREQREMDRVSREETNKLLLEQKGEALQTQLKSLNLQLEDRQLSREDRERLEKERQEKDLEFRKWQTEFQAKTQKEIAAMRPDAAAMKRQDKAEEAQTNVNMALNTLSNTRDKAKELLGHKGLWRITGLMGSLPNMPGSEAANAEAVLDQLKAMASVQMINDLRQASKTGGAVGQVTEREWGYLQNAAARLQKTQGTPAFKEALEDYVKQLDRVETLIQDAYSRQFGGSATSQAPAAAPSGSATSQAPAAAPSGGSVRRYNPATGKIE